MQELVELYVPDLVEVAWPNRTQIVWCWQSVQFSQVIFVILGNPWVNENFSIAKLLCVYVFLNPSPASVPTLYPMETSVIFKRGTEMEHWLEIG